MSFSTTDLCDQFSDRVAVAQPVFKEFGGRSLYFGKIETVQVFEDNVLVRKALEGDGTGRILVVDGGGSLKCALLGDQVAEIAIKNKWEGLIVHGCVRDTERLASMNVGIRALAAHPRKSGKSGAGSIGEAVLFAGLTFQQGQFIYVDADGVVLSERPLVNSESA